MRLIGEGPDDSRGDVDAGLRAAEVTVDSRFVTPAHHHNAMELHSVLAAWNGNELTLHDSTNAVFGAQNVVARAMNVPVTGIHVIAPFVGGSFGCKGRVWPHDPRRGSGASRRPSHQARPDPPADLYLRRASRPCLTARTPGCYA